MERNNNEDHKEKKPGCCTRFRTSMRNAGKFIYNSETKLVLGRSGISWLKVLSFYLAFYATLAGFWAACLVGFIRTLDPNVPTMQKMYSMMKDNPGMNFEPFVYGDATTLVSFDPDNYTTYEPHIKQLTTVYQTLENKTKSGYFKRNCKDNDGATDSEPCAFDMSILQKSNCTPERNFSFGEGKPCILLRINRVFLWEPNNITLNKMPACTTENSNQDCLKKAEFNKIPDYLKTSLASGDVSYVSVSCQGENDGDADSIRKVTFYPEYGFPAYFFPYYNQPNYVSPVVMAQFDLVPGRGVLILCKVWTRDIIHDKTDLQGAIHFELMASKEK